MWLRRNAGLGKYQLPMVREMFVFVEIVSLPLYRYMFQLVHHKPLMGLSTCTEVAGEGRESGISQESLLECEVPEKIPFTYLYAH